MLIFDSSKLLLTHQLIHFMRVYIHLMIITTLLVSEALNIEVTINKSVHFGDKLNLHDHDSNPHKEPSIPRKP